MVSGFCHGAEIEVSIRLLAFVELQLNGELLEYYSGLTLFVVAGSQLLGERPEIESGFPRIGRFAQFYNLEESAQAC